ncbi:MAG TPA: cytochrome C, partial [Archangium sp.]
MRRSTSWWRASSGELTLAVVLFASCTTTPTPPKPAGPSDITLFFSSEVRGYIGPCGCSENMRGGIARSAYQVEEARRAGKTVHFIDCGDGLFDTLNIPEAAIPQQERKAQALSAAWKKMGLEGRTGGPLDDARGVPFRESLGLPQLGSFKVLDGVAVLNAPTLTAAKASIPEATKAGGRFFVAIVPAPADQLLRDSMEPSGLHLVIASKSKDAFSAEESRLVGGATKVAQVQSKGRSLLEVQVHFRGDGSPEWLAGDGDRARELASLDQRIELLRAQVNEPMLADALKALRKAKLEEIIARREALASAPIEVPTGKSSVTARFVP